MQSRQNKIATNEKITNKNTKTKTKTSKKQQ